MPRTRICVVGTGRIGGVLVHEASARGYRVLALEMDNRKADELSRLRGVQVIRIHDADLEELRDSGAARSDLILATADDDEQNMRIITYAVELGGGRVVGLASDDEHREIFIRLGAEAVLMPARIVAERLLATLLSASLLYDVVLPDGARLAQVSVRGESPLLSTAPSEVDGSQDRYRIIDVARGARHYNPSQIGRLESGDLVTVYVAESAATDDVLESLLH